MKTFCKLVTACSLLLLVLTHTVTGSGSGKIDVSACIEQNWPACMAKVGFKLVNMIWKLHDWNSGTCVALGPYQCTAQIKGRFHKLKWVWDGKFTCPTMVSVTGDSRGKQSKNGAIEHAINDFILKVSSGNYLTAQQWNEIRVGPRNC